MEMNYLQEAENGKRICIDELRISDVAEFIQDINSDPDGYPLALCRIFYAGYSMGYKDASFLFENKQLEIK